MTAELLSGDNNHVNSKRKGSFAIAEAISFFTKQGMSVLLPVADCEKYDLVVDNGSLKKVQCKYTTAKGPSGGYVVDLRTFGGYRDKTYFIKYKEGDFDILFAYCDNGDTYIIPWSSLIGKSHITLGINSWKEYKC